jgi:hypothetical protein
VRRSKADADGVIHSLPPAPDFIGRLVELRLLTEFWTDSRRTLFSLIGLGGSGKTALVAEFLDRLPVEQRPSHLFVWSFYVEVDSGSFLRDAYFYFSGGGSTRAHGGAALQELVALLIRTPRALLVLDGLERIQHARASDTDVAFGHIEDATIRQLITRLAAGLGSAKCVVTSRFPLIDVYAWQQKTCSSLDVDQLSLSDAMALLRRRNLVGDETDFRRILGDFGHHALTLDYLGRYLAEYRQGRAADAHSMPGPVASSDLREERVLAKVFAAYERVLQPTELAFLSRLCVFRAGTSVADVHKIFTTERIAPGSGAVDISGPLRGLSVDSIQRIAHRLAMLHLVAKDQDGLITAHPSVRDHFGKLFTQAAPIHRAVTSHILSAVPGSGLAIDRNELDYIEEVIYHALSAGDVDLARSVYNNRLGAYSHLAWRLGEYSRCFRVLEEFRRSTDRLVDPAGHYWSWRALGYDDERYSDRASIKLLRGRLTSCDDPVARFLQGERKVLPLTSTDSPLPQPALELYIDDVQGALKSTSQLLAVTRDVDLDVKARLKLYQAEALRRDSNLDAADRSLLDAVDWIRASGSQEHLCLFQLIQSRMMLTREQLEEALVELKEGLAIAQRCGFGLYHVELAVEMGHALLSKGQKVDAARYGEVALNGLLRTSGQPPSFPHVGAEELAVLGASHPECNFVWGETKALQLLAASRGGSTTSDLMGRLKEFGRWVRDENDRSK